MTIDFYYTFLPALRLLMEGTNPYPVIDSLFTPPWLLLPLLPVAWLPSPVNFYIWTGIGVAGYMIAFVRMGFPPYSVGVLMTSPFVLYGLWHGNVDWIVLLGATMPPAWGVWLVMSKPQMGIVLLALWAWEAAQGRKLLKTFGPLCLACGIGQWLGWSNHAGAMPWNTALPLGWVGGVLVCLMVGWLVTNKPANQLTNHLSLAAAPLLSPYVAIHSWIGILLPLRGWRLGVGWVLSWMVVYAHKVF